MKAINLKTEYLTDPIGIDIQRPRLSWNCEGGVRQTAYRIVAVTDGKTAWDSGKVLSASMSAVYPLELPSRARVEWTLTLWDESDTAGESAATFFEMGLLRREDFHAGWISGDYAVNRHRRYPVDCFRRVFTAESVRKARLYITACGLYEACLNGRKVGDFMLAPGHTDYKKRIQLQCYDVTEYLKNGENILTVQLADGWYRGSCGAWGLKNQYGCQTKLLAQLEITDAEGKNELICSDGGWEWSNDGALRFADNQDGETVEAWRTPSFRGRAKPSRCKVIPTASNNQPLTAHERFKPTVITTPKGAKVLDFGQNIAGVISFRLTAKKGQRLKLRLGEMFDGGGEFTQKNIQCADQKRRRVTPLQEVSYYAADGVNEYTARFAIFGFQYVLVEGDIEWRPEDFTAIAVYSDMPSTLDFSCSHPLINKLVESTRWSAKNNHADVPTDCPTRERHGWTGDAQIFCNTAAYLFDYAAFARKYLRDMADGQRKNGVFRQISPKGGIDFYMNAMDGSPGWSDAGVLIPSRMFEKYGDTRVLRDNYAAMRAYAKFKIKTLGRWYPTALPTGIGFKYRRYISNFGQSYGEWAEPADVKPFAVSDFVNPHPEETTAYIVYMLEHMAKIARLLGENGDAEYFAAYAQKARTGYEKLVSCKKFSLDTDRQAKLVRPLYMNLLNPERAEFAKKRLLKALDNYGWRLGTGFLSTPFILYVLADIDIEYAYRLLENEEMPGWLFMPKMNANTIWESWEGTQAQGGVASLDHYSKGAVCEWLFDTMCGIKVSGENRFTVKPRPGGSVRFAECSYDSAYGRITSGWKRENGRTEYTLTVPSNTEASLVLPDGERTLGAGKYTFTVNN